MKRITLFLSFIALTGVLILTACGASTNEPTTVIDSPSGTVPAVVTETKITETTAVETQTLAAPIESPALTNTPTNTLPQTDDEWRAFITEKLQSHHSLDFLLSQNLSEQEWLDVLAKRMHADVVLTNEEKAAMIQWLMAH
jgi:hypothetical protein